MKEYLVYLSQFPSARGLPGGDGPRRVSFSKRDNMGWGTGLIGMSD